MKERSRFFRALAYVAVMAGTIALTSAQAAQVGKATVRKIDGDAKYSDGGAWIALKKGQELQPGLVVRTASDSSVVLDLKQNGPTVLLVENTTLGLDKLNFEETGVDTVIETQLDLKSGRIVGIVNKLSATSKYEIKTPNGVAGIRGTDYSIGADGTVYVMKGSAVVVFVKSDGTVVTQVVNAGEMFNPGTQKVQAIPQSKLDELMAEVAATQVITAEVLPQFEVPPILFDSPIIGKP